MKAIAIMVAAAALAGLAGCDRLGPSGRSASADRVAPGAAAASRAPAGKADRAPAANNAAAAQPGLGGRPVPGAIQASSTLTPPPVDRAFLIGRWTDSGDCREAGQFQADGQYTNAAGTVAGWALEGDRLIMTFAGAAPRALQVSALDQNTLNVVNPDGSRARSMRC